MADGLRLIISSAFVISLFTLAGCADVTLQLKPTCLKRDFACFQYGEHDKCCEPTFCSVVSSTCIISFRNALERLSTKSRKIYGLPDAFFDVPHPNHWHAWSQRIYGGYRSSGRDLLDRQPRKDPLEPVCKRRQEKCQKDSECCEGVCLPSFQICSDKFEELLSRGNAVISQDVEQNKI